MYLEIITPDRKYYEGDVDSATFPGSDGSFQVLNNHAPIISSLGKGELSYRNKNDEFSVNVEDGVVEELKNRIIVLVETIHS